MPVTVRSGTHKLVVEGLVQNEARAVVTTNASDIKEYASYLPIYHNESYVFFEPKYVSIFVVLDYPTYVVPSSGMLLSCASIIWLLKAGYYLSKYSVYL